MNMNNSQTVAGGAASNDAYQKRMAILDKPWGEATVEEKIEKVREELIQLGHLTNRVNNHDLELLKLKEHSHQDGKVVVPLNSNALNGIGAGMIGSRRNNLA